MTLNTELAAFRSCMFDRVSPAEKAALHTAEQQMIIDDHGRNAPREGDIAPDFQLRDQTGRMVGLYETLERGPVILTFYRGAWCPFCMITLRALQRRLTDAARIPATIMAISPRAPNVTSVTAETHGLSFPLLSDVNGVVGGAYALMFELPEAMRPVYERLGHALPKLNSCGTWAVPLTAGYVIGPDHRVAYAHLDSRIHVRMEPEQALAVARRIAAEQPAATQPTLLQPAN